MFRLFRVNGHLLKKHCHQTMHTTDALQNKLSTRTIHDLCNSVHNMYNMYSTCTLLLHVCIHAIMQVFITIPVSSQVITTTKTHRVLYWSTLDKRKRIILWKFDYLCKFGWDVCLFNAVAFAPNFGRHLQYNLANTYTNREWGLS